NFVGVKGQRALVLITDGKDTASKFSWEQAVEYARRAAVPIYAVGIGIRPTEVDTRFKLSRFCSETGATSTTSSRPRTSAASTPISRTSFGRNTSSASTRRTA